MPAIVGQRDTDRHRRLLSIVEEARSCTRCSTMQGRPRVLGDKNGDERARCLVLAEAPGPHGAGKTGIPLHGDRTGESFERLIAEAGIEREALFISNAVLCSPKAAPKGRAPQKQEVERCSYFVRQLLDLLDPAMVVTLGATALSALTHIAPHDLTLKWDVGEVHRWNGRFLLPLYHPGARAMIQRPLAQQKQDYALLHSLLSAD